jgi:sugar phosphate isomerase/epimerase
MTTKMLQPWSFGAPALSASGVAWDARPVAVELADLAAAGVDACGPTARRLESLSVTELRDLLDASGVRLGHAILPAAFTLARPELWEAETARAVALVDRVAALDGKLLVITAGPPGPLDFEAAAAAFGRAVAPLRDHAARRGVTVAVEVCNQLRDDLGFLYTLRDALDVARDCGIAVCADVLWFHRERDLARTLRDGAADVALVQVSDCAVGATAMPCRLVPGDGAIPLERLLGQLLESGYRGPFDLELLGPEIDREGPGPALRRGADWLRAALESLGA